MISYCCLFLPLYDALQIQAAVAAYLSSKQLLLFVFVSVCHDVKMSNLENVILTELYIVGKRFPGVLNMQTHYLVLRKA